MNITRRESLAAAIALLCELGAAKTQARAGVAERKLLGGSQSGAEPEIQPAAQPAAPANAHAGSHSIQAAERGGVDLVFKHDLPNLTMDDWEVTVSTVDFPPGRVGRVHHHAGFVLAYVLEGNIVSKVSGQEEKTYKPGEMFYEPPGSTHEVSNNASATQPAKLLAMILAKKGAQLTMPGPA
jgi:quercetin dioxygenase-like cupin family protein